MYGFVDWFEPNRKTPSNFEDIGSGDRRPCAYRTIARVKAPTIEVGASASSNGRAQSRPTIIWQAIVRRTCPDSQPAPGTHVTGDQIAPSLIEGDPGAPPLPHLSPP